MNKFKQRKRLTALALAFLLVFLTGAAFAFAPGMLDIIGQAGIREGDYVVWTLAHTPPRTADGASFGEWDNFSDPMGPRIAADAPNQQVGVGSGMGYSPLTPREVYINEATIITDDSVRGRTRQRIEWDVVFNALDVSAWLYIEASNLNEFAGAEITDVRVVTVDFVANDGVTLADSEVNDIFTIGGTFASIAGDLGPYVAAPAATSPAWRSSIESVTVAWTGALPDGFDYFWDDDDEIFVARFVIEFDYSIATA